MAENQRERGGAPDRKDTPEGIAAIGKVVIERRLLDSRSVIVSSGDFGLVAEAWKRHASVWQGDPDPLSTVMMAQGLAAAALHLANRPRDEIVAWTLNLQNPPTNIFLTGEAGRGIVTGRAYTEGVRIADGSRLYVQTLRAKGEPATSSIEVHGLDLLEIFEQYYERSEQMPARFFDLDDGRFTMVLGLPRVDRVWIRSLSRERLDELNLELRPLESRSFHFECGCSPRKMLRALRSIFAKDPEDLFRGEEGVETSCPRCGRRWWVTREQFLSPGAAPDSDN